MFQNSFPSMWIIGACNYTCQYLQIPGQTQVMLHLMAHYFEVSGNTISYSTEQHFITLSLP